MAWLPILPVSIKFRLSYFLVNLLRPKLYIKVELPYLLAIKVLVLYAYTMQCVSL